MSASPYINSFQKRLFDIVITLLILPLASIVGSFAALIQLLQNGYPALFLQKRIGKSGIPFTMIKIRTMKKNAETSRIKYQSLNQVDGPVFKIINDPRFVTNGHWLSKTGIDEIPQLINVLKGEMSLVGPRPLPEYEDNLIPKLWRDIRHQAKPGIMSNWVLKGAHSLKFSQWMQLDQKYITNATLVEDAHITTAVLVHQCEEILNLCLNHWLQVVIKDKEQK